MKAPPTFDLLGIGLGPSNLSLAALVAPLRELSVKFCESKKAFAWHPELMFSDATMQTSYLKDLVTPVDPTNPHSFLNYLVKKGRFYHFVNTDRKTVSRLEYEDYARWVSEELRPHIDFDSPVLSIEHRQDHFHVSKKDGEYTAKNLCLATGPQPCVPDCAKTFLGPEVFHAKSPHLTSCRMAGKRVLIVGGGQTGVEVFRNALKEKWGRARSLQLITGRENLRPLEEGPFVDEIYTPNFVEKFHGLSQESKDEFTAKLLLTSDGNTPGYLQAFYEELYLDRFYQKQFTDYSISPLRWLKKVEKKSSSYRVTLFNKLEEKSEELEADLIVLATGLRTQLPPLLDRLKEKIVFDEENRPLVDLHYRLRADLGPNHIYVMNFSRHGHGIADPQTSLMAYRSAVIANSLLGARRFEVAQAPLFLDFFHQETQHANLPNPLLYPLQCQRLCAGKARNPDLHWSRGEEERSH